MSTLCIDFGNPFIVIGVYCVLEKSYSYIDLVGLTHSRIHTFFVRKVSVSVPEL